MTFFKSLKAFGIASAVAVPLVLGTALPASATPPNSNIVGSGASVVYSPTSLTVAIVTGANCTSSNYSFSITNTTTKTQRITLEMGTKFKPYGPKLKPHHVQPFCVSSPLTAVFSLKADKSARLTVTAP